jgi:hypothetical protein
MCPDRFDENRVPPVGSPEPAGSCDRSDLRAWSERGGPLPRSLAAHVRECPDCARRVRAVNTVLAGLALINAQPIPIRTRHSANERALRFLQRAARSSAAAQRLLRSSPNLTVWQRAWIHTGRLTMSASAAAILLLMRIGLVAGIEETRDLGEQMAAAHWERHIDPTGEWLPRDHDANA